MNDKLNIAEKLVLALNSGNEKALAPLFGSLSFKEKEKSLKNIKLLLEKDIFRDREGELIHYASMSPDPDLALNNIERLVNCLSAETVSHILQNPDMTSALFTICGGSQFLSNILFRHPAWFEWLLIEENISRHLTYEDKVSSLRRDLEAVGNVKDLQKVLREFKQRDYLRSGVRDLTGKVNMPEVAAEISDLAAASLQGAYEVILRILKADYGTPLYKDSEGIGKEADFVVLGMGKLGGRELNFSSDIDLIFLYTTEKGETTGIVDESGNPGGQISNHEFFTKMGKMIVKALSEVTEDGFVFRVDMDLRPEGKSGDLACSVRSAEIYYESWGQTWERSAMLKARPVAGDTALGESFLQMLSPFMYRRFLDYTAIEEIRAMKRKIDASIARDDQSFTNIKLGTGGIREIEFFIQALQLINAGKKPGLRERNSLGALIKLKNEGLVSSGECQKLTDAYIFLRTVEHRLQIFQERQTHTLPTKKDAMEMLARRVGYRENPLEEFLKNHSMHTANVKEIYSSLFHEAAYKLEEETSPELLELLEGLLSKDEAIERLSIYGFKEPASVLQNLSLLWNGPPFAHFTEKSRGVLRRVAPFILKEIIASPEPDMAINTFERFISAVGARGTLYSLLAENHHVIKLLVGLFGTSSFLSKILLSYPETLDSLVAPGASSPRKSAEEIRLEMRALVDSVEYYEDKLDVMRRFRNVEMLRIGINEIYGEINLQEVSRQITALADVALEIAYELALQQVKEKYGLPITVVDGKEKESTMVIVGMGKLGAGEMAYSSDLDIIFLYSGSGDTNGEYNGKTGLKETSNQEFFARVGQNIISILTIPTREGYLFKVDMRLRPSGSSGTLVASLDAFRDYHKKSSQTWERQALTRARTIIGEEPLVREINLAMEEITYGIEPSENLAEEIDKMRKRMEFELAKERDGIYNVKTGKGGLVDIEFLVQYFLLRYGPSNKEIRIPNTYLALEKLKENSLLEEEEFKILSAAYKFLRKVETGLRIVHDQSVNKLDSNSKDFGVLARRLGYDSASLLNEYLIRTSAVRKIYNRYLVP